MTILQLIQKPQKRGAEIFAAQLSQHLSTLGHKVILVSLFEGDAVLPFEGTQIHLRRPLKKRVYDVVGWKQLATLIKKYQPEIVQANAGDTLKWVVYSKIIFGWEAQLVARNASTVSNYIKHPLVKKINGWLYRKADSIVSVAVYTKDDLNRLFPFTTSKSVVIPIGIEPTKIEPIKWKGETDAKLQVVHVGGFSFEKNHQGLLVIWKKVLQKFPEAKLHLLGDGPLRSSVQEQIQQLGLEKNIVFHGAVSNPMDYMAAGHLVVLPSIIEGLPGVLLEAMYAKTSVVAYDTGGISEIVKEKETGYLVAKNDAEAFAAQMIKALTEDNTSIIKKAYQMVKEKYTNNQIALAFGRHYKTLVNDKN